MISHKCEICNKELSEEMFLFSFDNAHQHPFCHKHIALFFDTLNIVASKIRWDEKLEKFVWESR